MNISFKGIETKHIFKNSNTRQKSNVFSPIGEKPFSRRVTQHYEDFETLKSMPIQKETRVKAIYNNEMDSFTLKASGKNGDALWSHSIQQSEKDILIATSSFKDGCETRTLISNNDLDAKLKFDKGKAGIVLCKASEILQLIAKKIDLTPKATSFIEKVKFISKQTDYYNATRQEK